MLLLHPSLSYSLKAHGGSHFKMFVINYREPFIIMIGDKHRMLPVLSTPCYTQTNVSPHKFHHFCTRWQASYVPQRLIFTNELVEFWSGPSGPSVDLVGVKPPFSNMFTLPLKLQLH